IGSALGAALRPRRGDDLVDRRWIRARALDRSAGGGEGLAEIQRRFRLIDLVAAKGEQIADHDPGDQAGQRQPPAGDEGVPIATELELVLGVKLWQGPLARATQFRVGTHSPGDFSYFPSRACAPTASTDAA